MSFKDLEQKHNLVNRVILACGKYPVDADINPLLEERLERFYEDAVIEGMAKQMHSSVDRAVNAMAKPWVELTDEDIGDAYVAWDNTDGASFADFARLIEAKLKEKDNGNNS